MSMWWCVSSAWYGNGSSSANIVDVIEADECPEGSVRYVGRTDYYIDWFDSKESAEKFVADVRNQSN